MQNANLFTRDDTMLGICEGLGEDLRINSNLIRLGFAFALFFNPVATVVVYLGLGVLVLATRLLMPTRTRSITIEHQPSADAVQPVPHAENDPLTIDRLAA